MTQAELYHRTFLPDGPFGPKCQYECHTPTVPRRQDRPPMPDVSSIQRPDAAFPAPFTKPLQQVPYKPAPYKPGQGRFRAYRFTAKGLYETAIVGKPDQDFIGHATPFEVRYSTLAFRGLFVPVVEDLVVVGHVGSAHGRRIFMPEGSYLGSIEQMVEEGAPLYVADRNPDENYWTEYGSPYVDYMLLTAIDGQILACLGLNDRQALEEADFWLLDAIFIGKGLASLGIKIGNRIVKSLVRRSASRAAKLALAGPTREIAQEAIERLSKDVPRAGAFEPRTGMTPKHFKAFQDSAAETQHIAIVRNTNPAGTRLIEAGCPGKPLHFKFHTSPRTGVVTAETAEDLQTAYKHGYFVVESDGVARRRIMQGTQQVVEEIKLSGAFWQVEKGQVIEAASRKPVVGDYDLMGVVDPKSMGQNIALHSSNGKTLADISSPIVDRFKAAVNGRMDQPRVMHGAQDQFAGFRGGATVFYPDGRVVYLPDEAAVSAFYSSIKRETIEGAYARPPAGARVVDELAARRAQR